ncbi:flavin reductase family protein [Streptosporangium sp. NPDC051022]|uniref:flavin reductase family protein n=1 Tax=Streptosporangium sp. NPDC051022 TaxID=3155752 RepID=UPI00341B1D5C
MSTQPARTHTDPVDPVLLRQVMRRFATGVTIVATTEEGTPFAAAVNSLTSVSLEPPLILVCFKIGSRTCAAVERNGRFSVSVLTAQQEEHSRRFAGSQPAADDPALEFVDGLPVIRDALAGMICNVESTQRKGDHVIVIGEVVRTHHVQDTPLLFFDSGYHQLASPRPA